MTTIQTIHQYRCDLIKGPSEVTLDTPIMHQDALGDVFRVSVWRNGKQVDLTGMTVRGFLYFASTRQTLLLEGSITDSCACITMISECYAIPGYASLVVQVQDGDVRHSLLKVNMCITRTRSEIVIDPGDILPTLPELLKQISAMEQATAEANATIKAVKADAADTIATVKADTAAAIKSANEATSAANTAAVELAKTAGIAITPTVSGSIVSITDGAERPAVSLVTHIEPVQEGEGDPSPDNVRPIRGWDKVTAQRTGKNLFDPAKYYEGSRNTSLDGDVFTTNFINGAIQLNNSKKVYVKQGTYAITLIPVNTELNCVIFIYKKTDGTTKGQYYVETAGGKVSYTITVDEDFYICIGGYYVSGVEKYGTYSYRVMLEAGTTATAYEPYQGQTLTAALPETVYGGTVDWGTGVLTVEWGKERFLNDGGWKQNINNLNYFTNFNYGKNMFYKLNDTSTLLCTHGVWAGKNATPPVGTPGGKVYGYMKSWIGMTSDYDNLSDFLAWLDAQEQAGTPVTVVYKLYTPYTIQLTPQQLETLKGTNNVWSDCGNTDLTYIADTKLYIDQKLAAIAAASL